MPYPACAFTVIDWNTHTGISHPVPSWSEDGMYFTSPNGLVHNDYLDSGQPDNGTPYMSATVTQVPLSITAVNNVLFMLVSVDLAEYSTVYSMPRMLTFTGHRSDGTVVSQVFTTDGIIDGTGPLADFETFTFNSEFYNLQSVTIDQPRYCMDNLVLSVSAIPEPSTAACLLIAVVFVLMDMSRRRMRTSGSSVPATRCRVR